MFPHYYNPISTYNSHILPIVPHMPYSPGLSAPGGPMGMHMPIPMHPGMGIGIGGPDPFGPMGMPMMGHPGLHHMGMGMGMGMGVSGFHPAMLGGGGMRSRHGSYYHPSYSYGGGRGGARYLDPYDIFDDIFDDDVYMDDYDDIDDPLQLLFRMQRSGGGRRGRRGRYGRYGEGGIEYHGFL
jgi:hypothetical protein